MIFIFKELKSFLKNKFNKIIKFSKQICFPCKIFLADNTFLI